MSHNEIEKAIKTMNALTLNAKEVLHKLTVWATTTESTIDFVLLDQSTGGYTKTALNIPTAFSLTTPYWGSPFNPNDRRDAFIDKMRFYSNEGGWVFDKQISVPDPEDPNYYQVADNRFWEFGGADILNQYYHNNVAIYTHVDALFRNRTTRFTHENTVKSAGVIDNSRPWYSYIDITGYAEGGFKTIMNGHSASISFGGNDTFARFSNENVYVGYSGTVPGPASLYSTTSLSTVNTYIDGINSIYIGCNSYYTPYNGSAIKRIYIGADDTTYVHNGNTEIGINAAKTYVYARDALWFGRAINTNVVASATNITGRVVNVATYSPTSGTYVYLNEGSDNFKLVKGTIGYIGYDRYSENYTLSAKTVAVAPNSVYAGFGVGSSAIEIGYGCGYLTIATNANAVDAYRDAISVTIGTANNLTNGYLQIGSNRYRINFGYGCKELNIGGVSTSAVFSGDLLTTKSVKVTEIDSIEDTIIKGGREARYGKRQPTVLSGMWNDSKYNLNRYYAEAKFENGTGIHACDSNGSTIDGNLFYGFAWNQIKYYEARTNNFNIRFSLQPVDLGGLFEGITQAVFAKIIRVGEHDYLERPPKVYLIQADNNSDINKIDITADVRDISGGYGDGTMIHMYEYPMAGVASHPSILKHIDIYENVYTKDIIIRVMTNGNPQTQYRPTLSILSIHHSHEIEPGYRKVISIAKVRANYNGDSGTNTVYYDEYAIGSMTDPSMAGTDVIGSAGKNMFTIDIFGYGSWDLKTPGTSSSISRSRSSHNALAFDITGLWNGSNAASIRHLTVERPLMVVHAYNDVSSVGIVSTCDGNTNPNDTIASWNRPGIEGIVVSNRGNYRTQVYLHNNDLGCPENTNEMSRVTFVDASMNGKTEYNSVVTYYKDIFQNLGRISTTNNLYVVGFRVIQRMNYDGTYNIDNSLMANSEDGDGSVSISRIKGVSIKMPSMISGVENSLAGAIFELNKSDFGTSIRQPLMVDGAVGLGIINRPGTWSSLS